MNRRHPGGLVVAVLLGCAALGAGTRAIGVELTRKEKIIHKLGRGFANVMLCWVEVPREAYFVTQQDGAGTGLTWGVLRGMGVGFVRLLAGGVEIGTFPLAFPNDYEPIIQPEFVFDPAQTDLAMVGRN